MRNDAPTDVQQGSRKRALYPFNVRQVGQSRMLTNRWGGYSFLSEDNYARFLKGDSVQGTQQQNELKEGAFYATPESTPKIQQALTDRYHFLRGGPTLHAMVLTERCNHGCQYCHSSVVGMSRTDTDMTPETAERAVRFALSTTSPWLTIEFQGGEPTANWEVLTKIVETARAENKSRGKELSFSLVTNFSLMTDDRMHWLIDNRVQVCTSLDGPEELHNSIRLYRDGNSFRSVVTWIEKFNKAYEKMGLDPTLYRIEALPTITKDSLKQPEAIVDTFTEVGCRAIFLRKLDPFGFAQKTKRRLGYSIEEFLDFYGEALEYIVRQNLAGVEVLERNAAIMLSKALTGIDPNYLDLRTPGGAAIGQLAYHPNGNIYSSDEGRMVAAMGDETFLLGNVLDSSYEELMQSPEVKSLVLASVNINEPGCNQCVYQPYCGLQPEYNYKTQGSLSGRMAESPWCRKHMGIFDKVFQTYAEGDDATREMLERWTTSRPRDHFIQERDVAKVQTGVSSL